jgi:hypothetical protein
MGHERVPIKTGGEIRPNFSAKIQYASYSGEADKE